MQMSFLLMSAAFCYKHELSLTILIFFYASKDCKVGIGSKMECITYRLVDL